MVAERRKTTNRTKGRGMKALKEWLESGVAVVGLTLSILAVIAGWPSSQEDYNSSS